MVSIYLAFIIHLGSQLGSEESCRISEIFGEPGEKEEKKEHCRKARGAFSTQNKRKKKKRQKKKSSQVTVGIEPTIFWFVVRRLAIWPRDLSCSWKSWRNYSPYSPEYFIQADTATFGQPSSLNTELSTFIRGGANHFQPDLTFFILFSPSRKDF